MKKLQKKKSLITAAFPKVIICIALLLSSFISTARVPSLPEKTAVTEESQSTFQFLFNAAVQQDSKTLKKLINQGDSHSGLSKYQFDKIEILYHLIESNEDKTETLLSQFSESNEDNPRALIFIGEVWKQLAHQVGFFSFRSLYNKGLQAHIKAFNLEPENQFYRSLAGSSFTQLDSDNIPKQRAILSGYADQNTGFHLLAKMDMAQNDRDHDLLTKLAKDALVSSPENLLVIERAAQGFWTAGDVFMAQKTFTKACFLPSPTNIYRFTWQHSCYLAGYLALKETGNYAQGIEALEHLLTINQQNTSYNEEIQEMKEQLIKKLTE